MKIRWNANGVRLRISPSELETLRRGERVGEELRVGDTVWRAELLPAGETQLSLKGSTLYFALSPDDLARLLEPEREGVYFQADGVRYFVEKDFPCAHPRASEAEEESEVFAAPPGFFERKNT